MPVSSWMAVTADTPEATPDGLVTTPWIPPRKACAMATISRSERKQMATRLIVHLAKCFLRGDTRSAGDGNRADMTLLPYDTGRLRNCPIQIPNRGKKNF